jgi:hypothetical protein
VGINCLNLFLLLKSEIPKDGCPTATSSVFRGFDDLQHSYNSTNPLGRSHQSCQQRVEITTREFEYLTSWLLHRGEHRQRERQGFSRIRSGDSNPNFATKGRRALPRGRWEACSRNPSWEDVQKQQLNGERGYPRYYPTNRPSSSSLSSSCYSWSTCLENHEAEGYVQDQKGKSKDMIPPSTKGKQPHFVPIR